MKQYLGIAKDILDKGVVKTDRTGTGTVSLFSPTNFECDLREGFPLLTTKKMFFRGIVGELLWFLPKPCGTNTRTAYKGAIYISDDRGTRGSKPR